MILRLRRCHDTLDFLPAIFSFHGASVYAARCLRLLPAYATLRRFFMPLPYEGRLPRYYASQARHAAIISFADRADMPA